MKSYTLLELMKSFNANEFTRMAVVAMQAETHLRRQDRDLQADSEFIKIVVEAVCMIEDLARNHEFTSTLQQCVRSKTQATEAATNGAVRDSLQSLYERLVDDFDAQKFLHLDFASAELLESPAKGWDEVIEQFPKVRYNVDESGKCFALERYGASVFHVLQVAEYGVIEVSRLLQVEGNKPGWASLQRLKKLIEEPYPKRTPLAQTHTKLLEDVVPLATIIKDNWRHKFDHVENQIVWIDTDFSPNVAGEIISATRAFMRKLALDISMVTHDRKAELRSGDAENTDGLEVRDATAIGSGENC